MHWTRSRLPAPPPFRTWTSSLRPEPPLNTLDTKDSQLLELLYRNARLPLKTIAARVGLARSSVRERVARLESSGVIRGYRAEVAWPAAGGGVQVYFNVRLQRTPSDTLIRRLRERARVRALLLDRR